MALEIELELATANAMSMVAGSVARELRAGIHYEHNDRKRCNPVPGTKPVKTMLEQLIRFLTFFEYPGKI